MIASDDRCADCKRLIPMTDTVFRASGGGLRCGRCDRKATLRGTCARADGCDVRRLCTTIHACAAVNHGLVLELATRVAKLAHEQPAAVVVVAKRCES